MDMEKLAGAIAGTLKIEIKKATAPLLARIAELEARKPEKGGDGKDADPAEIARAVDAAVAKAVGEIPRAKDGTSVTIDDVRPLIEEAVAALPKPQDGKDGASPEQVQEMVADAVKALPPAKDGESVTAEQVLSALMPAMDAAITKAVLDVERRAQGVLERAVANMPKPKDGRDGLDLRHFKAEQVEDRTVTLTLSDGERTEHVHLTFPVVIDRGVFREEGKDGGGLYERGDGVTFSGSFWIAQKDAPEGKPGASADWRLAVKSGRDGASAYQVALRNGFKGSEKDWVERGGPLPAPVVKVS